MIGKHLGERPDWDAWALGIAHAIGPGPTGRADCTRRKVGAVIIEPVRHRIIGAGYNGAEPGGPSCLKGECPRGRHYKTGPGPSKGLCSCEVRGWARGATHHPLCLAYEYDVCACGKEWPCSEAVAPGSSYDTGPGTCIASHAEQNALADVTSPERLRGATMYVTEEPCAGCVRQVRNTTDIAAIVWPGGRIEFRRECDEQAA